MRSFTSRGLRRAALILGIATATIGSAPAGVHARGRPAHRTPAPAKEAYLFVYFTGDSIEGEKLRFAVSEGNDALHWRELNGGRPVIESTEGTKGLRDPFILRAAGGDRFFLLATDLSAARTGWDKATERGSQYLEIWESRDLVHWGRQRHVKVNLPNAGMTWAPEASWDPTIDAYAVYWTSSLFKDAARTRPDGDGPQIMMATTRDFRTFSTPRPWLKAADVPGMVRDKGLIDATVLHDAGHYYRFTKGTQARGCASADVFAQRSRSLRAGGASGQWTLLDQCIGRTAGTPEVEGPSIFRANPGDVSGYRYYLWVDHYGGVGYIPLATQSLAPPIRWTYPKDFRLPRSPRHGSVLSITRAERDALLARWR
ncbi:glycoside hydrolase family 43 protein [uncultured Sphingomonas sp.]|uniref:glycoside hydrolase family 43 protein n=1 Tax=uncultured Sphingomonas sp. TaxID=158754 RepID=UPI0025E8919A|nr:glycoside hydrolase family 43 protein [uncultured Sphingomonas sp.]